MRTETARQAVMALTTNASNTSLRIYDNEAFCEKYYLYAQNNFLSALAIAVLGASD